MSSTQKRRKGMARGIADQVADGDITFDDAMRVFSGVVAKRDLKMRNIDMMLGYFDRRLIERGYLPRPFDRA